MQVRRIPADSPDALRLVQDMVDSVISLYGDQGAGPSATPRR